MNRDTIFSAERSGKKIVVLFMQQQIKYGIDDFLRQSAAYKNKRIGFVTNNAATTAAGIMSRVALLQNGFTLTKLFSPEHGISGGGVDGVAQPNNIDAITGQPVISLYGDTLAPTAENLNDIDLVVFDIPDVGCRFYTYLWTMTHVMEACAAFKKPLLILDRPNPIGAMLADAEGPFLNETSCASFIGRRNIPIKHCCTLGELAIYFAATKITTLNLEVIKVQHYRRSHTALHDFSFVPTSPAIQHIHTAMLYPGMGLLEGINVNEGRSTPHPFSVCAAPWINAEELLQAWQQKNIPGINTVAISYTPQSSLYAGEVCNGLQFSVTHAATLRPVAVGIGLLQTLMQLYPSYLTERLYPTAANPTGSHHLDKLLGLPGAFTKLKNGEPIDTNVNPDWTEMMRPYLLY